MLVRQQSHRDGCIGLNVGPALVRTSPPPPPNNFRTLNQELFEGGPGMVIVLVLVLVLVFVISISISISISINISISIRISTN